MPDNIHRIVRVAVAAFYGWVVSLPIYPLLIGFVNWLLAFANVQIPAQLPATLDAFFVALLGGLVSGVIGKYAEKYPWLELLLGSTRTPVYVQTKFKN